MIFIKNIDICRFTKNKPNQTAIQYVCCIFEIFFMFVLLFLLLFCAFVVYCCCHFIRNECISHFPSRCYFIPTQTLLLFFAVWYGIIVVFLDISWMSWMSSALSLDSREYEAIHHSILGILGNAVVKHFSQC